MDTYKLINDNLKEAKRDGKYIIYPFGRMGMQVKEILNQRYGIYEVEICDNALAELNPKIKKVKDIENPNEYVWLVAVLDKYMRAEILKTLQDIGVTQIEDVLSEEKVPSYGEGYYRLSKIASAVNAEPCREVLEVVGKKKRERRQVVVAEIGVDVGATSIEICKRLDEDDCYYCFDFQTKVDELVADLNKAPEVKCKIVGKGNTSKTYDSYCYSLSDLLIEMRNKNLDGLFDVVYLDAVHDFARDGLATSMLKEMMKPNGYIIFDDMYWSFGGDSVCNPRTVPVLNDWYTEEQLNECQVQRVVSTFMINDKRYREVYLRNTLSPARAVFERIM